MFQNTEVLTLLTISAYRTVLKLLEALREDNLDSFPRHTDMFTLPEQGAHIIQVTRFTVNTVLDQLGIEEHPLHPVFQEVASMQPSRQKRDALSRMNLMGARKGLEGVSSMQELRDQFEHTMHWMVTKIDLLRPEHWERVISHPLVEIEEECLLFLHRMLVIHTHHHFGEMVVLAKLAGHADAVPFAIGRVD